MTHPFLYFSEPVSEESIMEIITTNRLHIIQDVVSQASQQSETSVFNVHVFSSVAIVDITVDFNKLSTHNKIKLLEYEPKTVSVYTEYDPTFVRYIIASGKGKYLSCVSFDIPFGDVVFLVECAAQMSHFDSNIYHGFSTLTTNLTEDQRDQLEKAFWEALPKRFKLYSSDGWMSLVPYTVTPFDRFVNLFGHNISYGRGGHQISKKTISYMLSFVDKSLLWPVHILDLFMSIQNNEHFDWFFEKALTIALKNNYSKTALDQIPIKFKEKLSMEISKLKLTHGPMPD